MKRKISLLLATVWAQGLMGEAYAHTPAQSYAPSHKPVQFYAGLSGGVNRMTGRRSESVLLIPANQTFDFGSNLSFRDTDAQYSGFAGVSWFIPQTSFFIGPELHLGRTHTESKLQNFIPAPGAGDRRVLSSDFSQSAFFGATIKVGYSMSSYSGYIVLGGEESRFHNQTTYVPFAPEVPYFFKSRKWLKGFLWGFGLEKQVNCFRFGVEARFIEYGQYKVSYLNGVGDESVNPLFRPKNVRLSLRASYIF